MKNILFAISLYLSFSLTAQQKGVSPVSSPLGGGWEGVTRAVVASISDYQDPAIPDLRFADREAEAFANFLCSLDGGHLKLLTNFETTTTQFAIVLVYVYQTFKVW